MSSFWKFMGGLVIGAAAAHLINEEYKKRKQGPPPSGNSPKPESKVVVEEKQQPKSEVTMVEELIREYENKKNRTRRENDTLELLKIKLRQVKGY
jgi:hypothetical protein